MADSKLDVVIVGAGFAGLYMLHRCRTLGLTAHVIETGGGVGGTWYWNRYPGARCDVESMQYSYQFSDDLQQDWDWSERYSPQPEILRYANHVTDRFGLRGDITFNTRVTAASFDEQAELWRLETDTGAHFAGRFCVMATGCLSSANLPRIAGIDSFAGATYHTGRWPHEPVDFTGKRVAVIGTGSSAIQSIPLIAEQAKHLFVFQRTANYMVPAHNQPLDPAYRKQVKAEYGKLRARARRHPGNLDLPLPTASAFDSTPEQRESEYARRWAIGGFGFLGAYNDLLLNQSANDTAAEFVRARIRETVKDPAVAETLSPRNVIGCKRLCVDTGYWATFNRPNVTLVDVAQRPIEAITPTAVRANGQDHDVDAIVFATGFDAMTGALLKIDITGHNGVKLKDKWAAGPRSYLGLAVAGFPNLFTITGPGSPSVLTNMLPSIEQHVEWIADCIVDMGKGGHRRIEPDVAAEDAWVAHVGDVAGLTLRATCSSWYLGANVPGKPRIFMPYVGGFPAYVQKCNAVVAAGYEGFRLS